MSKRYWLMKSEADSFSIGDLERDGSTYWDGVRNYAARNNLRAMNVGDEILYYHSNAKPSGVVGLARVCKEAYPDPTQFDPKSRYHDPKSDPESPRWWLVDIEFMARFTRMVTLQEVKAESSLADMELVRYGRLSVQSVTPAEFESVKKMGGLE